MNGHGIAMRPPSAAALWVAGTVLLWAIYTFVFVQTVGTGFVDCARTALANVLPLALLAAATRALLKSHVMEQTVPVQAAAHTGLAIAFATTWYALVIVLLAFVRGVSGGGYLIRSFQGPAFTWQVFQGLVLYALVAAVCYAVRGGREAATVSFVDAPRPLERYLTKTGDEMRPVEVREIVSITGAQDYAEVATLSGRHLVRLSLSEFERRLDGQRFLRVHRSAIINFDYLDRTEPAGGGRMLAHMANGDSVEVSRAGAQLLRSFMV